MNNDIAIKISNLTKIYHLYDKPQDRLKEALNPFKKSYHNDFYAMDDVSFEIKKGDTVGIIGKNGAGKSTLLKMITGVLTPTLGGVETNGKIASLLELGGAFNPEMTGIENIYLNGTLMGFSKAEMDTKVDAILEFADIGEFLYQPMKVYSSGMFVRLAFAAQIATNPDILIIDEALAVGDAYFVHKCMLHFHKLKEKGTTILLVTHDITAIRTLCDRAMWLKNGSIEEIGDTTKVADKYLKYISKQQKYKHSSNAEKNVVTKIENGESSNIHETTMPNIDERYGDQGCSVVGFSVYDENMIKTTSINNNSTMKIKLSFRNNSVVAGRELIVGYCIRNNRGIDIASSSTEVEESSLQAPQVASIKTVLIEAKIPLLHPGSYSISVSIGCRKEDNEMRDLDSIANISNIDITSKKQVHVLMSLDSRFTEVSNNENL